MKKLKKPYSTFNTTEKFPSFEDKTKFTYMDSYSSSLSREKYNDTFYKYPNTSNKFPTKYKYSEYLTSNDFGYEKKKMSPKIENIENELIREKKNLIDSYGQEKNFERLDKFNRKLMNIKNKLDYVSSGIEK